MNEVNLNTVGKADPKEASKIMKFFQLLELVSQSPDDFDPNDHFNTTDPDYHFVIKFYNRRTERFDYGRFINEVFIRLGTGYTRILIGYEYLIEKYCDPQSSFLRLKDDAVMLAHDEFIMKGDLVCTAIDLQDWQKKIARLERGAPNFPMYKHVSAEGYIITVADVYQLEDSRHFPVKTYSLQQLHNQKGIAYQSKSNN